MPHIRPRRSRLPLFARFATVTLLLATSASLASAQGYNAVFSRDGVDVWAVGDAGRVGRSVDSGASFTTTGLGAVSLRDVAARGFTVLVVSDGGVVWRSTNSGGSWASATPIACLYIMVTMALSSGRGESFASTPRRPVTFSGRPRRRAHITAP